MRAAALAILLLWWSSLLAQDSPQPPCAHAPQPAYAEIGEQPNVQVWGPTSLAAWTPPPCTGWIGGDGNLLVALAGTFTYGGNADELLKRFGTISALGGVRYWSVTGKEWQVLVTDATALDGPGTTIHRADFAAAEMKAGQDLFFGQHDSRSTGQVVYRMRVRDSGSDRLVMELENVTPVRMLIVTLFKPGGMKFLYFLQRRTGGNWGFYALLYANTAYAAGNEASFINRAAAFYRHFIGVPTDGAPPLAPAAITMPR